MKVKNCKNGLNGTVLIPGDKSISHRAVMFGALANGTTVATNFLMGEDCLSTISCFRQLGVTIHVEKDTVTIEGKGIDGLQSPTEILDVGNSGTTIRLMAGILAGLSLSATLTGDDSIKKRPMNRVVIPLRDMGGEIKGRENGTYTPITITGGDLKGITYVSPVASAQVKSAILLAGLHAEGKTKVIEPSKSRDHTERMLKLFGVNVEVDGLVVGVQGNQTLHSATIEVPGDISSAAFFLVAGAIVPNSQISLERVGLNPTRAGVIDVLQQMGATLSIANVQNEEFEPYGQLTIETSQLQGTIIGDGVIPRLIDEIPILALAATQANGTTIIKDAQELKVKETNRIDTVVNELKKMGATIEATDDGMIVTGPTPLKGTIVDSHGDHRIGMMLAVAALIAEGETTIQNAEAVAVSYPNFFEELNRLM